MHTVIFMICETNSNKMTWNNEEKEPQSRNGPYAGWLWSWVLSVLIACVACDYRGSLKSSARIPAWYRVSAAMVLGTNFSSSVAEPAAICGHLWPAHLLCVRVTNFNMAPSERLRLWSNLHQCNCWRMAPYDWIPQGDTNGTTSLVCFKGQIPH